MNFQEIMQKWLSEKYQQLSFYNRSMNMVNPRDYILIYFEGFRIGWIEDGEFGLGMGGSHPSSISDFDSLRPADPQLFDKIQDRYRQIGVI